MLWFYMKFLKHVNMYIHMCLTIFQQFEIILVDTYFLGVSKKGPHVTLGPYWDLDLGPYGPYLDLDLGPYGP